MVQEVNISCIWVINNSSSRQKSFKVVVYLLWKPVKDSLYLFSVHLCFVSESLGRCYHISPNIQKHIAVVAINGLFYNKMYRDIKYYHFLWSASNVSYQLLVKKTINDFCMRSTDCKTLMGRHFFLSKLYNYGNLEETRYSILVASIYNLFMPDHVPIREFRQVVRCGFWIYQWGWNDWQSLVPMVVVHSTPHLTATMLRQLPNTWSRVLQHTKKLI